MNNEILNIKIFEILKKHVGGREFFDKLDEMIKMDYNIIDLFLNFIADKVKQYSQNDIIFYFSGEFGRILIKHVGLENLRIMFPYSKFILVDGGLSDGKKILNLDKPKYNELLIFIDDSIYSFGTASTIENSIQSQFDLIFVVYDGSKNLDLRTNSLFRYHK